MKFTSITKNFLITIMSIFGLMISIFIPIRKGSKRVKNKNIKKIGKFNLGLTEIKIKQIIKLKNYWGINMK